MKSIWSVPKIAGLGVAVFLGSYVEVGAQAIGPTSLKCEVTAKWQCSDGSCKKAPVGVWNQLNLSRKTYSRCDRNGCDTYGATIGRSGIYEIVEVPGRGLLAKVGDDGSFLEVATLGTAALISHGKCAKLK